MCLCMANSLYRGFVNHTFALKPLASRHAMVMHELYIEPEVRRYFFKGVGVSFLVLAGVSLIAFLYVRTTRQARQAWLAKIDLPGNWLCAGEAEGENETNLALLGGGDAGDFVRLYQGDKWRGQWRLHGHTLILQGEGKNQSFGLHFFKPGSIGLEDSAGKRLIYAKLASNVVSLNRVRET